MKQEINPQKSNRAEAFRMWMSSPMPMVTLVKTLDISRLVKVSKKSGIKFNVLMCWCIGKAANECKSSFLDEHMVIGTSAMIQTELDCIVNQYTDQFSNPMVICLRQLCQYHSNSIMFRWMVATRQNSFSACRMQSIS